LRGKNFNFATIICMTILIARMDFFIIFEFKSYTIYIYISHLMEILFSRNGISNNFSYYELTTGKFISHQKITQNYQALPSHLEMLQFQTRNIKE